MSKGQQVITTLFGGRLVLRNVVSKQILFILYIFVLIIFYISLHNAVEKTRLENYKAQKEIQTLHAKYVRLNAELMRLSQRQEVEAQLKAKGSTLHAPENPPYWINYED